MWYNILQSKNAVMKRALFRKYTKEKVALAASDRV